MKLDLQSVVASLADHLEQFKLREHTFVITTAIVIGILCGFAAVLFRLLIGALEAMFWGTSKISLSELQDLPWWIILLAPAVGGLLAGPLIHFFSRESRGHGVPEVMLAVSRNNGIIRPRVALVKALTAALTIASGGSAGREGPIIQVGSAIGSSVGQLLQVSRRKMRVFVGCGAAAGIAATFNAPIAGALFSVEVILAEFGVAHFSPIVISSVLATVVARHYLGGGPVFDAPAYELASSVELGAYAVLGLVCGLVSLAFIRALYFAEEKFDGSRSLPRWIQPAVGGLSLGAMALVFPQVLGDGHEAVNLSLLNEFPWLLLLMLLAGKIIATSLTLGSGGSGGVFAPSLFMGAMTGGLIGQIAEWILGPAAGSPGGYALVGMGGVVAGTTHAPITAILIIFEITNNYSIILPLMTVCILSILVSSRLHPESIYTMKIAKRGIDLFKRKSMNLLQDYQVRDRMMSDFETVQTHEPLDRLVQRLMDTENPQFYVVDETNRFHGVLELDDLGRVLTQHAGLDHLLLAEDIAEQWGVSLTPDQSLSQAMTQFERTGKTELPVIHSQKEQRLVGVLKYSDLLAVYNQELIQQDTPDAMAERLMSTSSSHRVRLLKDFSLMEWDPPQSMWDCALRDLNLPDKYGIHILLVKRSDEQGSHSVHPIVPDRHFQVRPHDTLIIYGRDEDLNRVQLL